MSAVQPTARKRILVRGTGAAPPGVPMKMFQRLKVTLAVAATSGDVAGWPALRRARSVTVIASGIAAVVSSGNHFSVTEGGYGAATRYVPSAAAAPVAV